MSETRAFWVRTLVLSEAAIFFAWRMVVIIPIKVVYNALNDNILLYFSGIWLIFASIHGYRSYRSLKAAPNLWYKEPHIFLGLADICWLCFFWLIEHIFDGNDAPFPLFLIIIILLVFLIIWSAFIMRKYSSI
jgi:hypothetical protein